jgi:hypothetical protein
MPVFGTFMWIFYLVVYLLHEMGIGTKVFAVSEPLMGTFS